MSALESAPRPSRVAPWLASYPAGVAWQQTFEPKPIPAMFDAAVERYGKKVCTHFLGRTTTYAALGEQVERVAGGLARAGVGKGARVAILMPNAPAFIVYTMAILKVGGVVVPCNPLYTVEELGHQIADSGAELMVTFDLKVLFDKVEALLQSGRLKRAVVAAFATQLPAAKSVLFKIARGRELANLSRSPVAGRLLTEQRLLEGAGRLGPVPIDPAADLAVLQYTGGTTGVPKGAMLTHANLSINVQQSAAWSAALLKAGEERALAVLPFFHIFGFTGIMLLGLTEGSELILLPRFDIDQTMDLIAKAKPTVMPGVPTLFNAILNHKDAKRLDLRSLKVCLSGGAPLPAEVRKSFEELTGARLVEAYGLSETSPGATCNPLDGRAKAGSIGQPLPATSISIRDPAVPEREMPLGQSGEICIAGPQVMRGYWQQPDETKAVFVDGYLRTGDVGYMDKDGFVFIVDRLKDMIIASGFKVYPRHVEEKIYQHPAVEEVTVIGIPDAYRGEAPKAFIKLKAGASLDEAQLRAFLEPKLSKIEMPAAVEFRDVLPKTMIGKLSKKELRAESAAP